MTYIDPHAPTRKTRAAGSEFPICTAVPTGTLWRVRVIYQTGIDCLHGDPWPSRSAALQAARNLAAGMGGRVLA